MEINFAGFTAVSSMELVKIYRRESEWCNGQFSAHFPFMMLINSEKELVYQAHWVDFE